MSGLLQLVGLISLAFLGSSALEHNRRGLGAAGLYVLLGVLVGPLGLSFIDGDARPLLVPTMSLCATWLAFVFGIRLRAGAAKRLQLRGVVALVGESGGVLLLVASGVYWLAPHLGVAVTPQIAIGIGIASAASGQAAIHFARLRLHATGPLTSFLENVVSADDLVPFAAVFALAIVLPGTRAPALFGAHGWLIAVATLGLGGLLGLLYALAAGQAPSSDRGWVVLIGILFLGAGTAARLGLPEVVVGTLAGFAVASAAGGRLLVRVVSTTERPVTLLLLVLIGARLAPSEPASAIALLALGLRLSGKILSGPVVGALGGASMDAGMGLLGYGGLALASATQLDLLYGGSTGAWVLMAAAAHAIVGDILGPVGTAVLLRRHGELAAHRGESP